MNPSHRRWPHGETLASEPENNHRLIGFPALIMEARLNKKNSRQICANEKGFLLT